jgi:hypothetical protein
MGAAAPQGKAHLGGRDTCVSALGSSRSCGQSGRSGRWLGERDSGAAVLPCGATGPGARCVDGLCALKGTGGEGSSSSHCHTDFATRSRRRDSRAPGWWLRLEPAVRGSLAWVRRAERRGLLATGALRRSTRTDRTKRNSGLGGGGGNTQAAVRTKRQQTGRRGGTPSTCCLVALSCRVRTSQWAH